MGLLDYYRQFEGMSDEEVNARAARGGRRAPAQGARARRAARPLADDLARAPPPRRRRRDHLRRPARPQPLRRPARARAARRARRSATGSSPTASSSATAPPSCSRPPPPRCSSRATSSSRRGRPTRSTRSWPAAPGARAVPVPGLDADAILGAVTGDTRMIALCNPNDPTGALPHRRTSSSAARRACPSDVALLLDEALRRLRRRRAPERIARRCSTTTRACSSSAPSPRPTAWPGMRVGYALGGAGSEPLLEQLEPPLGVGEPRPGRRAGGAAQVRGRRSSAAAQR